MNQHKDVVTARGIFDRRAANFRADSPSSFLINLDRSPQPAFLYIMHKILGTDDFASEKKSLQDIYTVNLSYKILTGHRCNYSNP